MLEKIGKYEIRLQIGRGAMGVVNEAQAVGRLSHPHIVTIHDYGDWAGTRNLERSGRWL